MQFETSLKVHSEEMAGMAEVNFAGQNLSSYFFLFYIFLYFVRIDTLLC